MPRADWAEGLTPTEAREIAEKYGQEVPESKQTNILEKLGLYHYSQLTEADKQPPVFIIEGMIPVGLTFLSGAPKTRKSFMSLQMANAVATGTDFIKHSTKQCDVAYLDLEGSKWRIASRATQMGITIPENIYFTQRIESKLADGLVTDIKRLHVACPSIQFVIIDTFSRARGTVRTGGANAYDVDVQLLEPLQQMAIDEQIAVLCIHHDKKGAAMATDSFERLNGTMGISGSADSVITLSTTGKRFDGRATLEYTPRDAPGGEHVLQFNPTTCEWEIADSETDLMGIPIISFCIQNAPDSTKAPEFIDYRTVYSQAYRTNMYVPESVGDVVRKAIAANKQALFDEYGVAVQTGVKSHGERGIRLMRT